MINSTGMSLNADGTYTVIINGETSREIFATPCQAAEYIESILYGEDRSND